MSAVRGVCQWHGLNCIRIMNFPICITDKSTLFNASHLALLFPQNLRNTEKWAPTWHDCTFFIYIQLKLEYSILPLDIYANWKVAYNYSEEFCVDRRCFHKKVLCVPSKEVIAILLIWNTIEFILKWSRRVSTTHEIKESCMKSIICAVTVF